MSQLPDDGGDSGEEDTDDQNEQQQICRPETGDIGRAIPTSTEPKEKRTKSLKATVWPMTLEEPVWEFVRQNAEYDDKVYNGLLEALTQTVKSKSHILVDQRMTLYSAIIGIRRCKRNQAEDHEWNSTFEAIERIRISVTKYQEGADPCGDIDGYLKDFNKVAIYFSRELPRHLHSGSANYRNPEEEAEELIAKYADTKASIVNSEKEKQDLKKEIKKIKGENDRLKKIMGERAQEYEERIRKQEEEIDFIKEQAEVYKKKIKELQEENVVLNETKKGLELKLMSTLLQKAEKPKGRAKKQLKS
ncbi:rho GTPase-activating protein gacN-like [Watersipora subatra]|uniref:rho GTPase-activating protein gacN-like n=1 Tax=Watersipora subatra TaxID=2589382 RepID=UPI00355BE43F